MYTYSRGACIGYIVAAIAFIAVLFAPFAVSAQSNGTLSISPSTGVYGVGQVFSVRVLANTGGGPINAADGTITFNNTELSVVALNRTGSIFNLWTQEPSFSNGNGSITFGGGSPSGYTGGAGTIFTITFKALKAGTSKVTFTGGSMLAADGKGTNIVGTLSGGTFTIADNTQPEPEYVAPANTPAAPQVKSSTHPDPEKWYTSKDVEFSWNVPSGVTNVRLTADQNAGSIPAVYYDTPITGKSLPDFDEGAWYMHVQFRNSDGWGRVAHFPFNIDTSEPESFTITQNTEVDPEDPRMSFIFDAVDAVSGVEDYEIQIDGGEFTPWKDDGSHIYKVDNLTPGQHTMVVRAYDKAGNFIVDSIQFVVASVDVPVITDYPEVLPSGNILVLRGVALPESTVTIHIKQKGEEVEMFDVPADETGSFTYIAAEKPEDGIYQVWAVATDVRGAISDESETVTIAVQPSGFLKIGSLAISWLSIIIPLIALILLAILFILYMIKHVIAFRKKIRDEATEAEEVLHEAITQLHFALAEHVKKLENARKRRALTKEEQKLVDDLNKKLDDAEKIVSKEIKDIKKVQ